MKPRKWHIWDLPEDEIRLMFNKEDYDEFFFKSTEQFDSLTKFADFLNIPYYVISSIKNQKLFIPLEIVRRTLSETNLWSLEGTVRDNRIVIAMKNKKLIEQIKALLIKTTGDETIHDIREKDKNYWSVSIGSSTLQRCENIIKLVHETKKKDFLYAIKKSRVKYTGCGEYSWVNKLYILKLLNNNLSVKEISRKLFINSSNVNVHLRFLCNMGLVKQYDKYKHSSIWTITEKGSEFLKNNLPNNKPLKLSLPNWYSRFNLPKKDVLVLLSPYARHKIFWMLERIFKTQDRIGSFFGVTRNAVSNWKRGENRLKLSTLNNILILLGYNGVDMTKEIKENIQEIRHINGTSKIFER